MMLFAGTKNTGFPFMWDRSVLIEKELGAPDFVSKSAARFDLLFRFISQNNKPAQAGLPRWIAQFYGSYHSKSNEYNGLAHKMHAQRFITRCIEFSFVVVLPPVCSVDLLLLTPGCLIFYEPCFKPVIIAD